MASKAKKSKLEQPKVASLAKSTTPTEEPTASIETIAETCFTESKTPTEIIAESCSAESMTTTEEPSVSTETIAETSTKFKTPSAKETPKEKKEYKQILSFRIPATEKRGFEITLFGTSNHLASNDMFYQLSSHATDFQNTFKITLKEEELRFLGDELMAEKVYTEFKTEKGSRVVKLSLHRSTRYPSFVYKMITVMPRGEKNAESDVDCYAIKFTIPATACKSVSTAMKNFLYLIAVARDEREAK